MSKPHQEEMPVVTWTRTMRRPVHPSKSWALRLVRGNEWEVHDHEETLFRGTWADGVEFLRDHGYFSRKGKGLRP